MWKQSIPRPAGLLFPLAIAGGLVLVIGCALVYVLARPASVAPVAEDNERRRRLVAAIVADAAEVWRPQFTTMGKSYVSPALVLVNGRTETPCGIADWWTGPFYCSNDQKIYVDPDFFREVSNRLHAANDFAG